MSHESLNSTRPADVCQNLLAALDASEGRRRRRRRDTTPDAIGLAIKRSLLERVLAEDPNPEAFEEWLLNQSLAHNGAESAGAVSAMARIVFEEWRMAHALEEFRVWLDQGAPSADADNTPLNEDNSLVLSRVRETVSEQK
ncbi:MAG: hypothetical protein HY695_04540 [Deltaproteobacteria bacterium]|nr:hypothetical protein [Deltaproteobacteria bacterium]